MAQITLNGGDVLEDWHNRHALEYAMTEKRLADTKAKFMSTTFDEARDMFVKSYVYAVISQQSPVDIYEPAYVNWLNGMEMATAFQPVTYNNQKIGWISDGVAAAETIDLCVSMLRRGKVNDFIDHAVEHVKGLGYAKAPFVSAMLGFTEAACADTNVSQVLGIGKVTTRQDYDMFRQELDNRLPIEKALFVKQWIAFDFKRGYHETHKPWFQAFDTWSERGDVL